MNYVLGETNEDIQIETLDDYKRITLSLAEQARNSIDIFTQNLEAEIYNNIDIERAMFALSKRHPNTNIRILVQDSRNPVQNGHRLIKLAQQITSSVFIHNPCSKHGSESGAFMVVDSIGFIYRSIATTNTYSGDANYKSPMSAARLSEQFNTIWEQSNPDIHTRRIFV